MSEEKKEQELTPDERLEGINTLFELAKGYWQQVGANNSICCQFLLTDTPDKSWFIQVNGEGGKAEVGTHDSPKVIWKSSSDVLENTFKGIVPQPGQLEIQGDLEILKQLFTALHQSSPYKDVPKTNEKSKSLKDLMLGG